MMTCPPHTWESRYAKWQSEGLEIFCTKCRQEMEWSEALRRINACEALSMDDTFVIQRNTELEAENRKWRAQLIEYAGYDWTTMTVLERLHNCLQRDTDLEARIDALEAELATSIDAEDDSLMEIIMRENEKLRALAIKLIGNNELSCDDHLLVFGDIRPDDGDTNKE